MPRLAGVVNVLAIQQVGQYPRSPTQLVDVY